MSRAPEPPAGWSSDPESPIADIGQPLPAWSTLTRTAGVIWALFTGFAFLMLGNGLQATLVGIRTETEGFPTRSIGVVMAGYFLGILVGSRTVTRALTSVGHIRVFAALASLASAASLVYLVAVHPVAWFLMRFTTGFCMAGLYVVAESWINDLATNETRGRLLSIYMTVSMGGFAGGQVLLNVADPSGFELFIIASVLISLSLVPVSLSAAGAPPTRIPEPMSLPALAAIVPTGVVVSLLVGMANGSLLGLGPVFATRVGMNATQISLFMGAPMVGGVLGQFPVGILSDRFPRRGLIVALAAIATAASGAMLLVNPGSWAAYGLMFIVGACTFPLYSLAIAYSNDWIQPEQILGATAALVTSNAMGAVIGPFLATGLMAMFGNDSFFVALVLTHATVGLYLLYRIATQRTVPIPIPNSFRPFPSRASAAAAAFLPPLRAHRNGARSPIEAVTQPVAERLTSQWAGRDGEQAGESQARTYE